MVSRRWARVLGLYVCGLYVCGVSSRVFVGIGGGCGTGEKPEDGVLVKVEGGVAIEIELCEAQRVEEYAVWQFARHCSRASGW